MFRTMRIGKVNNRTSVLTRIMKMQKIVILITKRSVIHVLGMVIKVMNVNLKKTENDKIVKKFLLNRSQYKIEKSICINNMSVITATNTGFEITVISEKC